MIRRRAILTTIWLASFAIGIALIEALVWVRNADGYRYILPQQRLEHMLPLIQVYSTILAGILAFWFLKPFKGLRSDAADRSRFRIALACALVFNVLVLAMVLGIYIDSSAATSALQVLQSVRAISAALGFLVAPVHFYYFGVQSRW